MSPGATVGNTSETTTLPKSQLTIPTIPLRVKQILSKRNWLPSETKEINQWRTSVGLPPFQKPVKIFQEMPPKKKNAGKKVASAAVSEAERRLAQSARDKAAAKGKQKVQKSLVKSGAKQAMGDCENRYLCQLLDPEQYGPSSYPDDFGDQTTCATFIYNSDVPIDSDSGEFGITVNPTLPDHVQFLENVAASTAKSYKFDVSWHLKTDSAPMTIGTGLTTVNFGKGFGSIYDNTDMSKRLVVDDGWIMLPAYTAGTLDIVTGPFTAPLGFWGNATGTITCSVTDNTGAVTSIASNNVTVLPNGLTKIKIGLTNSAGPINLISFPGNCAFTLRMTTAAAVTQVWQNHAVANYDNLFGSDTVQAVYTNYRTVAMTALITYKGDTLYDGGTIAGRYMEGGATAADQGFVSYDTLSVARGSYDGASKKGAYAWWKPRDTEAMEFRNVDQNNDEGLLPHLVFFGKITTSTISSAKLRLRVAMVLEASTTTMFVPVTFSRVAPWEIEACCLAIQSIPRIMENPLHVETIRQFLRDVIRKGQQITASVRPHLPMLMAMAKTAAPLLGL